MITLKTPLKNLGLITPNYYRPLEKMGLKNIENFLFYFPFRYEDFSKVTPIQEEYLNKNITVEGIIEKTKINRIWKRRLTIIEIALRDNKNNVLKATWFNQSFILNNLSEGLKIRLAGKLEKRGKFFVMANPAWERAARDATNTARLVPIYPETKGLTSKWIRWQMKNLLQFSSKLPEIIPPEIVSKFNLFSLTKSIQEIHFPTSKENLLRAQKYFAFQEMFLVQLKALSVKSLWQEKKAPSIPFSENLINKFIKKLPYKLTLAQEKAIKEILNDLEKKQPMNRLLNGDVGSGKTIVAAITALSVLLENKQVAIMAPTEVLAYQHFESFCQLFKNQNIKIALLTNSYKIICNSQTATTKKSLLGKIKMRQINLVIGTHALIQKDVNFNNLSLVVIDEQHRFGVAQRAFLQQETMQAKDGNTQTIPHLLTMTATPIPRSLAIAFFGSLDLSILDEMPKNRKSIVTQIISSNDRERAYEFIREEIKKGRQAFIIFPLVEDSKAMSDLKSAVTEHQKLTEKIFPDFKLGLLHGKLKSKEKEKVMQDFKNQKTQILVSTSVIEVGIDIPNATIMMIEDAERFGLSQLHQFRGRVGRGNYQSFCFLFSGSDSEKSQERLEALEKSNDGFEIAQKDLEIRGPGHFFGTLQSGLPDIAMENLTNLKLIKLAREEAEKIIQTDSDFKKHPQIKKALEKFQESVHLE